MYLKTALALALLSSFSLNAQIDPILPQDSITRVSEHVYAILGWPNVVIVVGSRATLVVDTGMGPRNGATVMRQVEKLAKSPNLYLTTTHFHPEHSSGEAAFPPRTVLIRPAVQQEEMNRGNAQITAMFSGRSAVMKELLQGVTLRNPDVLFDRELKLDLGGVTARLMWLGGGHTRGDELVLVEPDNALISGDILENKLVPALPNEDSSVKGWLGLLDRIESMHPRYVLPDHGQLGDGSLVAQEKAFLLDLQSRTVALKKEGKSADEAAARIAAEFPAKYPGWEGMGGIGNAVRRAWSEAQAEVYRKGRLDPGWRGKAPESESAQGLRSDTRQDQQVLAGHAGEHAFRCGPGGRLPHQASAPASGLESAKGAVGRHPRPDQNPRRGADPTNSDFGISSFVAIRWRSTPIWRRCMAFPPTLATRESGAG